MSEGPSRSLHSLPPPVLVEDQRGFEALLGELEGCAEVAFDTEADSFFNYREKVCLIQVTAREVDYLIDPLAGFDLEPLGPVLADPDCTKVFHDGEFDVLILKREYGFRFAGIFDTRVAAAALGQQSPGLAAVLHAEFGVELDKSQQRSDWSRRPLSAKQIAYARLDTRFLLPLMRRQRELLEERDRLPILDGECRRIEALEPPERHFDPDEFIRLKGARALSGVQRRVLRELFALRDRTARERDVPPFKVLGNAVLVDLARSQPNSARQLSGLRGFPQRLIRSLGEQILETVGEAERQGPLDRLPRLPSRDGTGELSDEELELHERLKSWRKQRAVDEELDASLVLNRLALLELATRRPADPAALARIDGIQPWLLERYGEGLLRVITRFERDLKAGKIPPPGRRRRRDPAS